MRGIFVGCCASARWTEARIKPTSKATMALVPIPALFTAVHCQLSRTFFIASQARTPLSCQSNVAECQDTVCLKDYVDFQLRRVRHIAHNLRRDRKTNG